MNGKPATLWGLVICILTACVPTLAHHGGSEYDQPNLRILKGTVTEFLWANPHWQVFVDAA
jgi:hypothetical protein